MHPLATILTRVQIHVHLNTRIRDVRVGVATIEGETVLALENNAHGIVHSVLKRFKFQERTTASHRIVINVAHCTVSAPSLNDDL